MSQEIAEFIDKLVSNLDSVDEKKISYNAQSWMSDVNILYALKESKNDCTTIPIYLEGSDFNLKERYFSFGIYIYLHSELRASKMKGTYIHYDAVLQKKGAPNMIRILHEGIQRCKKKKKIIALRLGIGFVVREKNMQNSHSNLLIINYLNNTIERYEPHLTTYAGRGSKYIDKEIKNEIVKTLNDTYNYNFKYITPIEECPMPLSKSIQEIEELAKFDWFKIGGFCTAYSALYALLRINYPLLSQDEIMTQLLDRLNKDPATIKTFMIKYVNYQNKLVDKLKLTTHYNAFVRKGEFEFKKGIDDEVTLYMIVNTIRSYVWTEYAKALDMSVSVVKDLYENEKRQSDYLKKKVGELPDISKKEIKQVGYLGIDEYKSRKDFLKAYVRFNKGIGKLYEITAIKFEEYQKDNHECIDRIRSFVSRNGTDIYYYLDGNKIKLLLKGNYDSSTIKLLLKREVKEKKVKKNELYRFHIEIDDELFDKLEKGTDYKTLLKSGYPEILPTISYISKYTGKESILSYKTLNIKNNDFRFLTINQVRTLVQYCHDGLLNKNIHPYDILKKYKKPTKQKTKTKTTVKDKPIKFRDYGIKAGAVVPYNKKEQKQFLKTNYSTAHPLLSKKLNKVKQKLQYKMKLNIVLKKHQKNFIVNFINSYFTGGILFHTVGSGKTLTAVAFSHYYLSLYPNKNVCIISPPALLFNFVDALKEYGLDIRDNRYKFQTYGKFLKDVDSYINEDTLLIIDEVHNFRTEIKEIVRLIDIQNPSLGVTKETAENKSGQDLITACFRANKILAMTGTPFVNKLYDIENTMAMITQRTPLEPEAFETITDYDVRTYDYFKYRISHFDVSHTDDIKYYPEKREVYIPIILDTKYSYVYNEVIYGRNPFKPNKKKPVYLHPDKSPKIDNTTDQAYKILKTKEKRLAYSTYTGKKVLAERDQLTSFKGKIRQYGNIIGNFKIKYILKLIKKNPTFKTIVYSSFIDSSLKPLMEELNKERIRYVSITGSESTAQKQKAKLTYNDINSGVNVLIISSAGTEGVSTKNTRQFILFESQWNEALTEQAVARAIRFKSHSGLPPSENYCNIYKLTICSNEEDINDVKSFNDGVFEKLKADVIKINDRINRSRMKIYHRFDEMNKIKGSPYYRYLDKLRKDFIKKSKEEHKKQKTMFRKKRPWEFNFEEFLIYSVSEIAKNYVKNIRKNKKYVIIDQYLDEIKEREQMGASDNDDINSRGGESADISLIKISIRKKVIINEYINSLDEYVPMIEDYKEPLHNKLIEAIDKNENVEKLLKKQKKILDKIGDKILENSDYVNGLLLYGDKKRTVNEEELKERMNSIEKYQEFYTPEEVAVFTANLSEKIKSKEYIRVLEPTCGQGNLLRGLIEVRSNIPDVGTTYDMCEIQPDSRGILEQFYVKKDPYQFNLVEEPDFLQFIPSEPYDLIVTNPPFHLKKQLTGYDRDYWDIDFVQRAYGMLKRGGELIAIVSLNLSHGLQRYDKWIKKYVQVVERYENYKWDPFKKKAKLKQTEEKKEVEEKKKTRKSNIVRKKTMKITLNFQIIRLTK